MAVIKIDAPTAICGRLLVKKRFDCSCCCPGLASYVKAHKRVALFLKEPSAMLKLTNVRSIEYAVTCFSRKLILIYTADLTAQQYMLEIPSDPCMIISLFVESNHTSWPGQEV